MIKNRYKKSLKNYLHSNLLDVAGIFFAAIMLLMYVYMLLTIDRGVSVDEGYYLQGYVQKTTLSGVSDFHNIIKSIFCFLNFDNALFLRYFYFGLSLFIFVIFAIASYHYAIFKQLKVNKWMFLSLISATWIISYCFSSPMLNYDTFQLLIYLLVFSLLFISQLQPRISYWCIFGIGFLLPFGITNYLPSGVLLVGISVIWLFTNNKSFFLKHIVALLLGFIVAIIIYSIFIQPITDYLNQAFASFIQAQNGKTGHNSGGLITKLGLFVGKALLVFIPSFTVFILLLRTSKKIKNEIIGQFFNLSVIFVVMLLSFFMRMQLGVLLLLIPFALLIVNIVLQDNSKNKSIPSNLLLIIIIFICTPIFGVFGTNQELHQKTYFFLVFWFLAFAYLYSMYAESFSSLSRLIIPFLFFMQIVFLFSYNGYFKRVHNYYGNKDSRYNLTNTLRLKNIKISQHQKAYIERVDSLIKHNGFLYGDEILGFETNLLPIYAVGGVVSPNNLFYARYNMAMNENNIPSNKVSYILLYKRDEKEFIHFMKNSDWNFPNSYNKFELGRFTENMTEEQNTVLYIEKK